MGRPRKNKMFSLSLYEDWLAGKNHKLQSGAVVRKKTENKAIGVIQFALSEMETYRIKWYIGPKPWDYIEGVTSSIYVTIVNEPSPLKYKWSERVPGPSSDEIDRLEAAFAKAAKKPKTVKDVEVYVATLEEELNKKKVLETINESKVDSIADHTLEEDTEIPFETDGVDRKIKDIINEE